MDGAELGLEQSDDEDLEDFEASEEEGSSEGGTDNDEEETPDGEKPLSGAKRKAGEDSAV